jgi:hypothetical protein
MITPEAAEAWKTFQATGLLWWINRSLHLFGWTIALDVDLDERGRIVRVTNAYPERTKERGFSRESEERGFARLEAYLKDQS